MRNEGPEDPWAPLITLLILLVMLALVFGMLWYVREIVILAPWTVVDFVHGAR